MSSDPIPIKLALISVSHKTGIVEFAQSLHQNSVQILSTGGTAKVLKSSEVLVQDVSNYTGFEEILDGRVKTLHPLIHGGILARGEKDSKILEAKGIHPIGLVVANLYPFKETVSRPECTLSEAIETIDIGGPAMLRASAKNYQNVAVVVDQSDYSRVIDDLETNQGWVSEKLRFELALKAFEHTAQYDQCIANYLSQLRQKPKRKNTELFPKTLDPKWVLRQSLRYGENPHQKAAFYVEQNTQTGTIAGAKQIQGKPLSYNNIADMDTALGCVKQFHEQCACVIVKHANPCGVAVQDSILSAYEEAYSCDPESAFGGIIALNQELDEETVQKIMDNQFVEGIITPSITKGARNAIARKESLRVMVCGLWKDHTSGLQIKSVEGGIVAQFEKDELYKEFRVVSKRLPNQREMKDLKFAWKVVRWVKSNAIVFATNNKTIGIGAGQTSRVNSVRVAAMKAKESNLNTQHSVMASDAFFPFRDSIDIATSKGITCVIQPGGSKNDQSVIDAVNDHGIAMVFTGTRHFKH